MKTTTEKKTATLRLLIRPSIKAMAVKLAQQDGRSLASYLEQLIQRDTRQRHQAAISGSDAGKQAISA